MEPLEATPILIDQVYDRILAAIAGGGLRPGERIRQGDLADRLGVSRQPVSHALHLLKRQRLVEDAGRKGLQIAPIDPAAIRQLYEVRTALDGLATRLAAERVAAGEAGPGETVAAEAAVAAGEALGAADSVATYVATDVAFHRAIHRLSGNRAIEEMLAPQWPHLMRSMAIVLATREYRRRVWAEHRQILRLIQAGDAARAEAAARRHTERAGGETTRRLRAAAA
jgi:DNA-binding GntR family transcriptional regulator